MIRELTVFALVFLLSGCVFERVDFKYSSDVHLKPADRFCELGLSRAETMKRIESFIARIDAEVLEKGAGEKVRFVLHPESEEIWTNYRKIFEQEFAAYKANDPDAYFDIDRSYGETGIQPVAVERTGVLEPYYYRFEAEPRTASRDLRYTFPAFVGVFVPVSFSVRTDEQITSVAYVWLWRDEGKTVVYARAGPKLGGIEAAAGNSVVHDLWEATTGEFEGHLIQSLLEHLKN